MTALVPDHTPKCETDMQIPSHAVTVATLWFDLTSLWFLVSVSFWIMSQQLDLAQLDSY